MYKNRVFKGLFLRDLNRAKPPCGLSKTAVLKVFWPKMGRGQALTFYSFDFKGFFLDAGNETWQP
jgi:hypothetical protein